MKGTIKAFLIITYVYSGILTLSALSSFAYGDPAAALYSIGIAAVSLPVSIIAHVKLGTATCRKDLRGIAILTLIFGNAVAGILMLCISDSALAENAAKNNPANPYNPYNPYNQPYGTSYQSPYGAPYGAQYTQNGQQQPYQNPNDPYQNPNGQAPNPYQQPYQQPYNPNPQQYQNPYQQPYNQNPQQYQNPYNQYQNPNNFGSPYGNPNGTPFTPAQPEPTAQPEQTEQPTAETQNDTPANDTPANEE